MTTWREILLKTLTRTGDSFNELTIAIDEGELDREFSEGFGTSEGAPFTAWSERYVYFPAVYDGSEWIEYVPRHPNNTKTRHIGGE